MSLRILDISIGLVAMLLRVEWLGRSTLDVRIFIAKSNRCIFNIKCQKCMRFLTFDVKIAFILKGKL